MINVIKWFLIITLLISPSYCRGNEESTVQEVINEYISADWKGARLSGETSVALKKLVTWEDEPGWDIAYITDKIQLCNIQIKNGKATAEIKYHIIGIFSGEEITFFELTELLKINLQKINDKWKIKEPIFPPHISPETTLALIERQITQEKAEKNIKKLEKKIEALKDEISFYKNVKLKWFECENNPLLSW